MENTSSKVCVTVRCFDDLQSITYRTPLFTDAAILKRFLLVPAGLATRMSHV